MFKPLALYVGLRYTRAKRRNHFISFISLTSMLGIALGVAVLITVLSVMNGFDHEIHKRFFGMASQITVSSVSDGVADWQALERKLTKVAGVTGVAPFVGGQGLMTYEGVVQPAYLTGISLAEEPQVSELGSKMVVGQLSDLKAGQFGIILGQTLAEKLGLSVGDKVNVMIPKATVTPVGILPQFKRFTVTGVFSAGSGFNFDTSLAFIDLTDAQKLFQMGDKITGIRLKISNIYAAPMMSSIIARQLSPELMVSNWTQQFGAFFHAVSMEKTMMFLILVLIIAVAAFNLVSSLVMVVNDKQADIAILRTFGALPKTILGIFMVQGSFVGIIGTLLGLIGGIILALNATDIVNWLQNVLHMQLLSSGAYFVDYLPSRLQWTDVWHVCLVALGMSFLATIYPAWRASRTQPAEALRYE